MTHDCKFCDKPGTVKHWGSWFCEFHYDWMTDLFKTCDAIMASSKIAKERLLTAQPIAKDTQND